MCVKHIKDIKKVMYVMLWAEFVWGGVGWGKGYVRTMYVLPKGYNGFDRKLLAISIILFLYDKMHNSKCR